MKIFKLLIILFTLVLCSCEKDEGCDLPPSVHDSFGFKFLNEDGVNILRSLTNEEKNKIKLTRKDGGVVNVDMSSSLNTFFLSITDVGEEPNGEVTKTFYINFSDVFGNINDDIDTLNFNYELNYQDNECIPVWFKSYKVFYNDSLYHDKTKYIPSITFLKK